jgi:hypothetical protein
MSEIKVNKISPKQTCTQLTLGDSGDTIIIPAGATITNNGTATGFGRTGTVDWDTTAKTTGFTAVSGVGYFCNTTSSAFTVTLPATPTAGDIVGICDYANTFATNNLTVARNGSNIGGVAANGTLSTNGISITFVYVDVTQGWVVTDSGNRSDLPAPAFLVATGGTVLTCGNYKTHIFTGPGTFTVSSVGNPIGGPSTVDYLVVAGGGGGNGAGGLRISNCATRSGLSAPSMSPLVTSTGITVTATAYPITVGSGGVGPGPAPTIGNPSIFSTITSAGGGIAVSGTNPNPSISGGSGGGGGAYVGWSPQVQSGGSGNTPPVSPSQGNPGASLSGLVNSSGSSIAYGGGGGAGAAGSGPITVTSTSMVPDPNGGIGSFVSNNFFGPTSPSYGTPGPAPAVRYFAGGGSGFAQRCGGTNTGSGVGGAGGGGGTPSVNGVTNTGGAGGLVYGLESGAGGSGIVVIRYKFQ